MKKIEAVIPTARLDKAFTALKELNLGGLTYYDTKGRGEILRPEVHGSRGTTTFRPAFNMNSTIVIVVNEAMVDKVVEKLLSSTSTGIKGEGKIFVSDIDDAVDIGSKVRGEKAI